MQINRLFEIIYILLDKGIVKADELAERFEVSRRTVYRDIELLSQSGIPIYTSRGKNGGIGILENFVLDKSVLSETEQTEIISALCAMANLPNAEKSSVKNKLSSLFKKDNASWISVDFSDWNIGQKEVFDKLKSAVIEKRVVWIKYINSRGEISQRSIEPLCLYFKSRAWYLISYCRNAEAYRMFRLSRMKEVTISEEVFEREMPEYEYNEKQYDVRETEVTIRINPRMEYRVYDEFTEVTKDKEGYFTVKICCPVDEWLYGYILSFGEYAEVLSPHSVRTVIKEKIEKCLKNYL